MTGGVNGGSDDSSPRVGPSRPAGWPRISLARVLILAIAGISLYFLAPSLGEVFQAWKRLDEVDPRWFPAILGAELGAFICMWALQRLALRRTDWFAVVMSQLAANAFNRITPGGGATGTIFQTSLLADAGTPAATAGSALTTESLLNSMTISALPLVSIGLVAVTGTDVPGDLATAALIGAAVFVPVLALVVVLLRARRPLEWIGSAVEWLARRLGSHHGRGLGARLVTERDEIRALLGSSWPRAVSLSSGRWLFEYFALLATLVAIGASPDPTLTLLAFTVSSLLTLIPFTPGGIGFVEAGLTASLAAAGASAEAAVLATLVFRLVSFWLPLPLGILGTYLFRRRYPRGNGNGVAVRPSGG
jgi:uncharacterized protein (TIRG00374 family)